LDVERPAVVDDGALVVAEHGAEAAPVRPEARDADARLLEEARVVEDRLAVAVEVRLRVGARLEGVEERRIAFEGPRRVVDRARQVPELEARRGAAGERARRARVARERRLEGAPRRGRVAAPEERLAAA